MTVDELQRYAEDRIGSGTTISASPTGWTVTCAYDRIIGQVQGEGATLETAIHSAYAERRRRSLLYVSIRDALWESLGSEDVPLEVIAKVTQAVAQKLEELADAVPVTKVTQVEEGA